METADRCRRRRPIAPSDSSEATEVHTRILRLALGIEESRSYWEHVDPAVPIPDRALVAFEQRWFGAKSLERVRFLLSSFVDRYDAFPEALAVLRRWRSMDAPTRQVVCHWHLQLSDPLYRRFTGKFLVERRSMRDPKVDRDIALRWVKNEFPERWSEATCVQFASKLLSAASEAGVISPKRDPRALLLPKVPDLGARLPPLPAPRAPLRRHAHREPLPRVRGPHGGLPRPTAAGAPGGHVPPDGSPHRVRVGGADPQRVGGGAL